MSRERSFDDVAAYAEAQIQISREQAAEKLSGGMHAVVTRFIKEYLPEMLETAAKEGCGYIRISWPYLTLQTRNELSLAQLLISKETGIWPTAVANIHDDWDLDLNLRT